jgi:hypothetical protein
MTLRTPSQLVFGLTMLISSVVSAQYPTSTAPQRDNDKAALYTRYYDAKKISTPEQQHMAYELAQEYLKQFGNDNDKYAEAVKKFVVAYERAVREFELNKLFVAKNYAKVFQDGTAMLAKDPEHYFVLGQMAQAGYELARAGDVSRNKQTIEHARHALKLVETGTLPEADPFKDFNAAKGFLHFVVGWMVRNESPAEAAAELRKAVEPESPFKADAGVYSLLGALILKGEYESKAAAYNDKFGNKPPSPEQQAALNELDQVGARAVDAYARAVALTKPEQAEMKNKLLTQLTALYKSFHNESDAGLNELIAGVLSKPLP